MANYPIHIAYFCVISDLERLRVAVIAKYYCCICVIYYIVHVSVQVMVSVSSSKAKQTLLKAGMWFKGKDVDRYAH